MTEQEQREYDDRVRSRVLILQKLIHERRISFVRDPQIEKSLGACRYDLNGNPDLDTVDGIVRSIALVAEQMYEREKIKDAIKLSEIQNEYFKFIEDNFSFFYDKMIELKLSPHEAAHRIAYGDHSTKVLQERIPLILEAIIDFWEHYSLPAYIHVEDMSKSVKAIFGGDLFPAHNDNIASKCGIYVDTIVLPCPFIRSRYLFDRWDNKKKVYYFLKHGMNILQYKLVATADTDYPIVVVLPDKEMMDKTDFEQVKKLAENDGLFHAEKIFQKQFNSVGELFDFAKRLDTVDKLLPHLKEPQRVLFDIEYAESLRTQIINETTGQSYQLLGTNNPGEIVATLGFGRMSVCNELLLKSARLNGTPLIDAPTSWEYFKWKMEYDAERTHPDMDFNRLHIVKGLTYLSSTPVKWIGNIPLNGLIELRKSGAINEIRAIISQGIEELTTADALNFSSTSQRVFNNLNDAFIQHQNNITVLTNKKWKIAGKEIGSWIVIGTIEIASACIGTPLFGISAVVMNQLMDAPKLKDLPKSIRDMQQIGNEVKSIKKSPIGLMFKYNKC